MSELKDKILAEYKNGNIIVATFEGLQGIALSEFIKQPVDGILYDLNRDEATVLTFIDDPKWVNDYAVCQVIRALKSEIDRLKAELEEIKIKYVPFYGTEGYEGYVDKSDKTE